PGRARRRSERAAGLRRAVRAGARRERGAGRGRGGRRGGTRRPRSGDGGARRARTPRAVEPGFAGWVDERIAARDKARGAKAVREADRIRAELKAKGVEIEDTPSGTKWRMV